MFDAKGQESILLAHDLGGDLQNGARPLVQALDQPVGRGEAVGDEGFFGVGARGLGDLGMIALVDQNPGQGVAVEVDAPTAQTVFAHKHIGHDALGRGRAKGGARAGRQAADLDRHVADIFVIDAADPAKRHEITLGQEGQIIQQRLHGRIEPAQIL